MRVIISAMFCIAMLWTQMGCESAEVRAKRLHAKESALRDAAANVTAGYSVVRSADNNAVLVARVVSAQEDFHAKPTQTALDAYRRAVKDVRAAHYVDSDFEIAAESLQNAVDWDGVIARAKSARQSFHDEPTPQKLKTYRTAVQEMTALMKKRQAKASAKEAAERRRQERIELKAECEETLSAIDNAILDAVLANEMESRTRVRNMGRLAREYLRAKRKLDGKSVAGYRASDAEVGDLLLQRTYILEQAALLFKEANGL